MNKVIYPLAIALVLTAVIFTGCNTTPTTPEVEDARSKVDSAKLELKAAQKAATAEEWEAFKTESETKIRINELSIADFKDRMSASARKSDALYLEKIDKLEQQNKDMKARIDNYEKRRSDWASFKSEFNHDMDELGTALKDILVNNKK
jgi:uncharacterized protein (DUF3084 family)